LWKVALARLAAETGLAITVCHLPPGTSKWNKIEHRMFAHISMKWRGRPLVSHEAVVQLIGATTTREGLRVHAELDEATYPKRVKITDQQMAALPLTKHEFHPDWNYTLPPQMPTLQLSRPLAEGRVVVVSPAESGHDPRCPSEVGSGLRSQQRPQPSRRPPPDALAKLLVAYLQEDRP